MQHRRLLSLFAAILMLLPVAAHASSTASLIEKGNTCYSRGKYEDALKAYDEASVNAPEAPRIIFDKGAAYYRMDKYGKAENAWQKAAIKSNDPRLEAKAFFNLGNCAFKQGRRQEGSNPKKAISDCVKSVKYYQQSLGLLKKRTDSEGIALKKDASENLEMVRLTMKSVLDKLRKEEKAAKKKRAQQKQARKKENSLKKLIARQQELINRDKYFSQDQRSYKNLKSLKKHIARMAGDQARLQKETEDAAKQLTSPKAKIPRPAKTAGKHLQKAQKLQKKAVNQMKKNRLSAAQKNQQAALDQMKKAFSSLKKAAGRNGKEKQKQKGQRQAASTGGSKKDNQTQAGARQQSDHAKKQSRQAQKRNSSIDQMPGTAQSIIDQEQQYRQQIQQQEAASRGGYQAVGKDW